ncbi:succinate dehydrogenase assembly factor 4, mitochondrial-like [Toxorhynchites rutilus septentrionalis]|uniref:succinate dehydrogenase assembly factor 4, mitochondrial-like n=1 Tax=Toxorhynchites rutilus septentrionalis TaxID=329112 RepID=UPI00247A0B31|nr:succinate dehydrogenase assembly factor 4, mitochondrial-like [Toxorhynchites rutilus septentrionalis]
MTSKVFLNNISSFSARQAFFVKFVPFLTFSSKPPTEKPLSPRMEQFQKKLREKTPIGKLDEIVGKHPYQEKEPLEPWPNNTNPNTGEVGGPRGPEPTRYGDWERKGRVSDF